MHFLLAQICTLKLQHSMKERPCNVTSWVYWINWILLAMGTDCRLFMLMAGIEPCVGFSLPVSGLFTSTQQDLVWLSSSLNMADMFSFSWIQPKQLDDGKVWKHQNMFIFQKIIWTLCKSIFFQQRHVVGCSMSTAGIQELKKYIAIKF